MNKSSNALHPAGISGRLASSLRSRRPSGRRATVRRGHSRLLSIALVALLLGGCCAQMWKSAFMSVIHNAPTVVKAVEKVISAQYFSAVQDVVKVCSGINTNCPPKRIPPEVLSTLPLEVDFNLLHEFIGPNDQVQVTTVPDIAPEELKNQNDIDRLYGISESDNYKFVFVSHQDLYIYVFQIDATGELAWQFPEAVKTETGSELINPWHDAQGVNPVPAEQLVRVPENVDDWLYLNENGRNGVENFFIVASKSRQIELEQALARAVKVAQEEKAKDPSKFTETIINLPLVLDDQHTGLVTDRDGAERSGKQTIATEAGPVAYSPRTFEGGGETIILARSVLHLPPR